MGRGGCPSTFVRPLFSAPAQRLNMISSGRGFQSKLVRCLSTTTHTKLDGFQPHSSEGYFWVNSHGSQTLYLQTLVQKCARNLSPLEGKVCHGQIVELGLQSDTLTSNMLVNMYCKCGLIKYARQVFDRMPERSSVSWNTMIWAYTQKGYAEEGLGLFMEMRKERSSISEFTVSSVLCACAAKCAVLECKQLHAFAVKTSVLSNVFVGTALLDVYSKCNLINEASLVFDSMEAKSDVTWSSMVAGFVRNELYDEALLLYRQTQAEGVAQTKFTVSSVLSACAGLAALIEGKQVHAVLCKVGLDGDVYVSSSLVDMYAKCGSIVEAYRVFSYEGCKDLVLWNAIISGFSRHGGSLEVRILFEKMQQIGLLPNEMTYVSVLSACAHKGLVEEGRRYFSFMVKMHNVPQNVLHYSCLVDILGRAGLIDEAYATIRSTPFVATASMWGSFLASCRKFGNLKLAEIAAKNLFELEPNNAGNHILLSEVYAANKKWGDAARSRQVLRESLVKKEKGISWIEVKDKVYTFMVGETNHPQIIEIYEVLEALIDELRGLGYKTQVEHEFHDVEECKKEELLKYHSEKLALVFGLMAMPPGVPIRIMKNLRICGDCHLFMKFASKVSEREIIVRDVNRFHHFSSGYCSCGDFW